MVQAMSPSRAVFLALAAAVSHALGASPETELEIALLALHDDDQCLEGTEGVYSCKLQALQVKSSKVFEDSSLHVKCLRESPNAWKRDISSELAKSMAGRLAPWQKPIEQIAQDLAVLDKFVNGTMLVIENATGEEVVFDSPKDDDEDLVDLIIPESEDLIDLVGPDSEDLEDEEYADAWNASALPPGAAYVNKIDAYLNQEIKQLWKGKTLVDRKRMGVLNMMGSRPYGPHGEHPEEWEPQGFFPCSNCSRYSTVVSAEPGSSGPDDEGLPEVSDDEEEVTSSSTRILKNFYHCRLEQDYWAIVNNVKDLRRKVYQLSKELQSMQAAVRRFCNGPSGVYQPCPKDVCLPN